MPILLENGSDILLEDDIDPILLESEVAVVVIPPFNEGGFFIGMGGMMRRSGTGDD